MAKLRDTIPDFIWDEIVERISSKCGESTSDSWESSRTEEEGLTGDFWSGIRRIPKRHEPMRNAWDWDIRYQHKTFRGKGSNSPESVTGSDGIFEITVYDEDGVIMFQKGLLFQAKREKNFSRSTTLGQAERMEEIAPNGSIILVYREGGYYAIKSKEYIENDFEEFNICDFLIEYFMLCVYVRKDMNYNLDSETLNVTDDIGTKKTYSPKDLQEVVKLNIKKKRK